MTRSARHALLLPLALLTVLGTAAAQQPARPNDASRSVTLSLAEYNRLIDLANRPPATSPPPVAAVVASADLRIRVDRETARGVFTVSGDVLAAGLTRVSVLAGATIVEASAAGRALPLVADGAAHAAIVPGPGPFSFALEWGAPLTYTPGRASFFLPVPQAGSARATIDLPSEQADVHLSAGLITRRATSNGRTLIEATLDPGSSTEVWWSMRESAPVAAVRELRTVADVLTLITIGDADLRMATLIDVSVLQGELRTVAVRLPAGYEVTGVSGSSLEGHEPREGGLVLTVGNPAARSHQFLVTLERPHDGSSLTLDTGFITLPDVQRERGEVAVEGVGTLELTAAERDGMHRVDMRELDAALQSLARLPILAAFRYQRSAAAPPALALDVKRFADTGVLAAVADSAKVTTLVTGEGRALTSVALDIENRAQPFLKVTLPPGASIVSVAIAGEPAKPMVAPDGTRVPLLRPGIRPNGRYEVSFVYLHAGAPFTRKGEVQMVLPRMDIPVGMVHWEVFVPQQYSVRTIDGNAFDPLTVQKALVDARKARGPEGFAYHGEFEKYAGLPGSIRVSLASVGLDGEIRGKVSDMSGAALPGVTIDLGTTEGRRTTTTKEDGTFVLSKLPNGRMAITASLEGFKSERAEFVFGQRAMHVDVVLSIGMLTETITVASEAASDKRRFEPSVDVVDLQQRVAGVLPIRVDVPRAGTSHYFVRPLVVDEETYVTLRYKKR